MRAKIEKVVVDASALPGIQGPLPAAAKEWVLTPHEGEPAPKKKV